MTAEPHPIDIIVGRNLRRLRCHANMSQGELGKRIGVTYQQIQKYEEARNRLSASRLWECAQALAVPLEVFFADERGGQGSDADPSATSGHTLRLSSHKDD